MRLELPPEPVDGYVVEWYSMDRIGYRIFLYHGRSTYHRHVRWQDHPWSRNHPEGRGADFEDDWAIESRIESPSPSPSQTTMEARGRNAGWRSMENTLQREEIFATREEAVRYGISILERNEESLIRDLDKVQEALKNWRSAQP